MCHPLVLSNRIAINDNEMVNNKFVLVVVTFFITNIILFSDYFCNAKIITFDRH